MMILLLLLLTLAGTSFSQPIEFSEANAVSILKTLVLDIGPRPMGSPAEQRALEFAAGKFREYGCDSSFVLRMTVAEGVNTKSGVAVGVKRGRTGRIIVIGGHIDSSGPDVPGANDDGSGTACVIELSRVLCQRESESTIYFCCWGGEEQGLQGSKFFVDNFKEIDSVALMLQIDMADGAGRLQADPDGSKMSAPSWLVKSTFEIFYDDLRDQGLIYPTEAATLNLASGGSWGSDHVSFIDKGIPAIDFTSDPSYPIHSAQDSWENFTPAGLKRSGDLILKLFERFDAGVPTRSTEKYQLLQFGSHVFFIPYAVLWTFIVTSAIAAVFAFAVARRRRLPVDIATKIRWSRSKLLVAALLIQACIWISETLIGAIAGYRFPWVNNQPAYQILGFVAGAIALWLVLQMIRRFRLSEDAYIYVPVPLIALLIGTVLSSVVTPELGMFFAASLLFMSFAIISNRSTNKIILFLGSFLVLFSLMFFDGLELFQRIFANNMMSKWWQEVLVHVGFVVVFGLASLPFLHAFAAVYHGSGKDFFWLRNFRSTKGLVLVSVALVLMGSYLVLRPSYNEKWNDVVRVEHDFELGADTNSVIIKGSEYFDGLTGTINGRDTTLEGRSNFSELPRIQDSSASWLDVIHRIENEEKSSDTTWRVQRMLEVRSRFRPLRVSVAYSSDQAFEVESPWSHGAKSPDPSLRESTKRKIFNWYSFPDTLLRIPVTFAVSDSQRVFEKVEVVFDSVAYPIDLKREFTTVSYRTTISAQDTFSVKTTIQ